MTRTSICMAISLAVLAGCAGGEDDPLLDTSTDTAVDPDTSTDTVTPDGVDVVEDTGTDTPVTCEGSDSLTLEFVDADEAGVEGVRVALKCSDREDNEVSGTDGRVTFTNLDLTAIPVDFTWVHDGIARSWVGVGGDRTVPDPFTIHVEVAEDDDPQVTMVGDIVHTVADSYVLITTTGTSYELTQSDRYSVTTPAGETGLPMFVMEYTSPGRVATPVGYSVITYDSPATDGDEGPAADPSDSTFSTHSFDVTFAIDAASPLLTGWFPEETGTGSSNRLISGARITGTDADERFLFFGFTTNWDGGFSTPTIDIAWVPEGMTLSTETRSDFWIIDAERNMFGIYTFEGTADTWSTITIHDLPDMSTFDTATPIPFDFDVPVHFPDWTDAWVSYHLRFSSSYGALSQDQYQWVVVTHPETTSFNFSELPWPTGANMDSVLPSAVSTYFFGVIGRCYDADPYADYVLLTDDTWASDHYVATTGDSRYRMTPPE